MYQQQQYGSGGRGNRNRGNRGSGGGKWELDEDLVCLQRAFCACLGDCLLVLCDGWVGGLGVKWDCNGFLGLEAVCLCCYGSWLHRMEEPYLSHCAAWGSQANGIFALHWENGGDTLGYA